VLSLAVTVSLMLTATLCAPTPARASPAKGITGLWNATMCAPNGYERVKTKTTEFAVSDAAGVCVRSEKYHATFAVTRDSMSGRWRYANIASGYTPEGEPTCADPLRDTCIAYPVRADRDGTPEESFGSWLAPGSYNEAFDIWFSPVESRHSASERGGDTELMIWAAYPGIDDRSHFIAYATIDGKRFGIMSWIAGAGTWRYVAYLWLNAPHAGKGRQLNISGLWLNPFFRNAERHGWLKPSEWLYTIDLGFELRWGGVGDNIHDVSLTGMRVSATPPGPAAQAAAAGCAVAVAAVPGGVPRDAQQARRAGAALASAGREAGGMAGSYALDLAANAGGIAFDYGARRGAAADDRRWDADLADLAALCGG
jgi:hypothetical protein